MPEGHTVHRIANEFNRLFRGTEVQLTSPQGRFSAGAAVLSGKKLKQANAVGKQMFLLFENGQTLRIHLGIFGKWGFKTLGEGEAPADPYGEVRARFRNEKAYADLRGPTICEVINPAEVLLVLDRLGPDPLNPDPDGLERDRFVGRVQKSRSSIGLLLMNQAVISGIGNVYRAEMLFRAGISPHDLGNRLSTEQLHSLWDDAVALLKVGVKKGVMITRDELFTKRPTKAERNFVYKREGLPCRVCGTNVSIEIMAARKLYWCTSCQK